MQANFPPPIVVVNTTGNGLQTNILDVNDFITKGLPPVIQIYISNAATVSIRSSGMLSSSDPPTLVNYVTLPTTYTASTYVDLVGGAGIYYQFFLAGNNGTVVVYGLPGAASPGTFALPHLVRMTTNATLGM